MCIDRPSGVQMIEFVTQAYRTGSGSLESNVSTVQLSVCLCFECARTGRRLIRCSIVGPKFLQAVLDKLFRIRQYIYIFRYFL
jgi:hypothetical protein